MCKDVWFKLKDNLKKRKLRDILMETWSWHKGKTERKGKTKKGWQETWLEELNYFKILEMKLFYEGVTVELDRYRDIKMILELIINWCSYLNLNSALISGNKSHLFPQYAFFLYLGLILYFFWSNSTFCLFFLFLS